VERIRLQWEEKQAQSGRGPTRQKAITMVSHQLLGSTLFIPPSFLNICRPRTPVPRAWLSRLNHLHKQASQPLTLTRGWYFFSKWEALRLVFIYIFAFPSSSISYHSISPSYDQNIASLDRMFFVSWCSLVKFPVIQAVPATPQQPPKSLYTWHLSVSLHELMKIFLENRQVLSN